MGFFSTKNSCGFIPWSITTSCAAPLELVQLVTGRIVRQDYMESFTKLGDIHWTNLGAKKQDPILSSFLLSIRHLQCVWSCHLKTQQCQNIPFKDAKFALNGGCGMAAWPLHWPGWRVRLRSGFRPGQFFTQRSVIRPACEGNVSTWALPDSTGIVALTSWSLTLKIYAQIFGYHG